MAFANLVVKISGDLTSLDASTKKAVERVKSLGAGLSSVGQTLALGFSAPIAAFAGVALKAAGDIEALKLGLVSVAGGARQAEAQFRQLREVAKLPGLGLQEAVQGSINLQALGFSADKSKNLLLQFGNALATVGRGREDLNEVIRQLGQLGSRGVVTADNLKPIIERVPQVASIIREKFGAEALGNPAETFKKLGISSQDLIAILETELSKLPRVTGGIKNDFENLRDSVTVAMAKAGDAIAPFAKAFIDDFAVPAVEKLGALADAFSKLPKSVQGFSLGLTGIAVAAPAVILGIGTMLEKLGTITEVLVKVGGVAGIASRALAALPKFTVISIAVVFGFELIDRAQKKLAELRSEWQNDEFLNRLRDRWTDMTKAMNGLASAAVPTTKHVSEMAAKFGSSAQQVGLFGSVLPKVTEGLNASGEAAAAVSNQFATQTIESQVLARMQSILNQGHDEMIDRLARLRLGLINMWDGLPQFEVANVAVQKLGDGLRFVQDGLEGAANALRVVDFSKLDISPRKQNEALFGEDAKRQQKEYEAGLKKAAADAKVFGRQVSLVANDLARNITDLIFKGGKLKDVLSSTFAELGKSLVRSALEQQFKRIIGLAVDLASKIPGLAKGLSAVFGVGGSAAGGVASAAGGIGSAAGSVGSAAGGVAGAAGSAASGLAGTVTAIAGVGTLISSIVGNFQFAGMNKSLDLIVKHTLQTANQLIQGIQPQVNTYLPLLASIHDRLATVTTQGIGVYNAPNDAGLRLAGGGGGNTFNFAFTNVTFGPGTSADSIKSAFTEAARQMAAAGAV